MCACACVCVYVCVCVRVTERERGTTMWCILHCLDLNVNKLTITNPVRLMKGYYNGRYGQSSGKDAALPSGNDPALKDFVRCKSVFVLKKQVFWIAAPCGWVS